MFDLIEGIFSFAFGMVEMCFGLAMGMVEFVFGLLGGILSLILSLGGFILVAALVMLFIHRRRKYKEHAAQDDQQSRTYDVDKEEFTSFYDQFRTEA